MLEQQSSGVSEDGKYFLVIEFHYLHVFLADTEARKNPGLRANAATFQSCILINAKTSC